jgi:hypothetical protein
MSLVRRFVMRTRSVRGSGVAHQIRSDHDGEAQLIVIRHEIDGRAPAARSRRTPRRARKSGLPICPGSANLFQRFCWTRRQGGVRFPAGLGGEAGSSSLESPLSVKPIRAVHLKGYLMMRGFSWLQPLYVLASALALAITAFAQRASAQAGTCVDWEIQAPSPRWGAAMVFDTKRKVAVGVMSAP